MRVFPLLLTGLLALGGCGSTSTGSQPGAAGSPRARPSAASPPSRPTLDAADLAQRIHRATNDARRQHGAPALAWDARLVAVAAEHSRDMARRGFFDHVSPDGRDANERARAADVTCRVRLSAQRERVGVLENLYKTGRWTEWTERTVGGRTTREYTWQTPESITRSVVAGWLASPGHRRNLLDATARGEAIAVAFADDDSVYITQVLC